MSALLVISGVVMGMNGGPDSPGSSGEGAAATSLFAWHSSSVNRVNGDRLVDVTRQAFGRVVMVPCGDCSGVVPRVAMDHEVHHIASNPAQPALDTLAVCGGIGITIGIVTLSISICNPDGYTAVSGCSDTATCTSGPECSTGGDCTLAEDCSGGPVCTSANGCSTGWDCTVGDQGCSHGAQCTQGNNCSTGRDCTVGNNCSTGENCTNGPDCTEVEDCTEGTACSTGTNCTAGPQCSDHSDCTSEGSCSASAKCSGGNSCTKNDGCTDATGCRRSTAMVQSTSAALFAALPRFGRSLGVEDTGTLLGVSLAGLVFALRGLGRRPRADQ